jgi:hypothetical protein
MQILTGDNAERVCGEIIDGAIIGAGESMYPPPYCKGFYKDKRSDGVEVWVAFDNSTADCWVEEFGTPAKALDWCEGKIEAEGI